jgi:hypothetical protein
MRYPLLILGALCLMAFAPKPTVTTLGGAFRWAPDSTLAYDAKVFLSGPLGKNDLIRYTLSLNGGTSTELARTTATDTTFTVAAPAYSTTTLYKICARVFRGESASGGFKCAEQAFTRGPAPEPPAPVVDSISVEPKKATLSVGATQQFRAAVFSH